MKRTRLRARSKRQEAFDDELWGVTPELMARAEGSCEVMCPNVCLGSRSLHRHHRRSRRVRKDGKANSLANLLLVCQSCHDLIHKDRAWAREYGFLLSAFDDPDEVPVNRKGEA